MFLSPYFLFCIFLKLPSETFLVKLAA